MVACVLCVALAGCAAPDTPPPREAAVAPPVGWRSADGSSAIQAEWWRGFGDTELTRLVDVALARNVDLAIAVARVREARAQVDLARAALFPTIDASAAGSHSRSVTAFGTAAVGTSAQPTVQAAYEVDLFGRIGDQVSAARDAWLASAAARDAARLSVAAGTANAYLTLLGLDARRAVVVQTIESRAEALRLARSRAQAGYTSELELRQAEAEYQGTAALLPQVDQGIARAENALRLLTGDAPGVVARGGVLDALVSPAFPDAGLPSDLLRRRPDIAQAELSLAASDASLSVARKQFLPSLRLSTSVGTVFANALPDPITIWTIGGSILAPIFEGGRLTANVEGAAARRDQAAFAYRKAALTAFREVEDALAAVGNLQRQRDAQEAQRAAVAEALRHASNRYHAGYSSYLEQLDAQRSLLTADLALVQLRADQLNALVTLYQALGGGWSGTSEAVETPGQ
jgi:NodT family efflux transporter outer membrane factor (OMF) lipoprotein